MKITAIDIGTYASPLIEPFKTALRTVDIMESIVVRITTDNGIVSYGETSPTQAITGDTRESIISALMTISNALREMNTSDTDKLIRTISGSIDGNYNAKSAAEIAIYDLLAQQEDKPLYQYLGGEATHFNIGTTISLNPTEQMVADSIAAIEDGFTSLKIKLGDNPKDDIERIRTISHAVGTFASLKLDANQGWSPDETIWFLDEIERSNIAVELIEQPVDRYDLEGLKYIRDRTTTPILADESVFSPEDARTILKMDAVDMINIKLDKCGGISKALEIADICAEYDTKCMIGCMMEGAISVGAAAHVASARQDTIVMYDLDAPILCQSSPIAGGVEFAGSDIFLPNKAGLGIESVSGVEWLT